MIYLCSKHYVCCARNKLKTVKDTKTSVWLSIVNSQLMFNKNWMTNTAVDATDCDGQTQGDGSQGDRKWLDPPYLRQSLEGLLAPACGFVLWPHCSPFAIWPLIIPAASIFTSSAWTHVMATSNHMQFLKYVFHPDAFVSLPIQHPLGCLE